MMDCQKIENGLQHTDIGASAFHMDHNSAQVISEGYCPACKKKGLIQHLRTYHISFEEYISLCENPECIYPLGSAPLSHIVVPIDTKGHLYEETHRKRKLSDTRLVTSVIEPASKLTRSNNAEQTFRPELPPKCNGNNPYKTQSGQPDLSRTSQPNLCSATESMEQQMGMEVAAEESLSEMSRVERQHLSNSGRGSSVSQTRPQDKKSLPETLWLQWRNAYSLCWLDCVLSATVHLETLKAVCVGSVSGNVSIIQKLCAKYNQATALVNNCQRGENILDVPSDVLSRAESYLNEIRNIIFVQLQSRLKCKLGEEESPVFAFPLLLQKDVQIEKLFLHSFSWKFECVQCGHQATNRCQKTLTTFTNIIPEWHPLNAVHIGPCNNCSHTSQRRKMVLENVASVLMMHFVEGLPHNDLAAYSFRFQEYSYQVKAVVQYQKLEKHFITWVLNSDEAWLECDDLKGSYCKRHKSFGVAPAEVHIVIWERKPPQVTNSQGLPLRNERAVSFPSPKAPPKPPVKNLNDKPAEKASLICHNMSDVNPNEEEMLDSKDRNNLLGGLEVLTSDDIVRLNLESIPPDSEGKPLEKSHLAQNDLTAKTGAPQVRSSDQMSVLPPSPEGDTSGNKGSLLEPSRAALPQGQPASANSASVMPAVSTSNISYSPAALSAHEARPDVNLLQGKNGSLVLVKGQNEDSKTKSGIPNIVQHIRDRPANSVVPNPGSSSPFGHKRGTKLSTASWVKGLLGKHPLLPKSVSARNEVESSKKRNEVESSKKEDLSTSLAKHAGQFCGFQAKWSKTTTKQVAALDSSHKTSTTSPFANFQREKHSIGGNEGAVTKRPASSVTSSQQIHPPKSGNKNSASFEHGETEGNTSHQLRLKLLQELKAKKEKLASLDKLAKAQTKKKSYSKKTKKEEQPQPKSQRQSESLQSLLNALEHQIDVEYSKSVDFPLAGMPQCVDSGYDDILSELLSPAPTVASLELPQEEEEECRYLEMGGRSPTSPAFNEKPDTALAFNPDLSHTTPEKQSGYEGHSDLLTVKSSLKKLDFESPTKQDILDELLPNSVLDSVMANADDLHHFDESLLTW